MRVVYNDGTAIKLYEDGKITESESGYIKNYIETGAKLAASKEWKSSGYGAKFRGEVTESGEQQNVDAYINSLNFIDDSKIFYSFSVNDISGVYKKDFNAENKLEAHVIHSHNVEFLGADYCAEKNLTAVCARNDVVTGHIATLNLENGDYRFITGGDSYDCNPSFSKKNHDEILYDTAGVGRDYSGNFVAYSDRAINSINTETFEIKERLSVSGKSLIKPKEDSQGNLYYIEKPAKYKSKRSNIFLDILLIPFKLILAIYRFLESFVMMFTGKTFTSHDSNPTKGRKINSRQIMIDGNLINVDTEYKRNKKNADKEAGIVPKCWRLMRRDTNGVDTALKCGVTAFDLTDDGIVYSNGRAVYLLDNSGHSRKLAEGALILGVCAE